MLSIALQGTSRRLGLLRSTRSTSSVILRNMSVGAPLSGSSIPKKKLADLDDKENFWVTRIPTSLYYGRSDMRARKNPNTLAKEVEVDGTPAAPLNEAQYFKGTKKNVSITVSNRESEEQHVQAEVAKYLTGHLWQWENFQPILPPTTFENAGDLNFTRVPGTVDERRALSIDANGNSIRLSPQQFEQVWKTGTFQVPSRVFPDQSFTWQLSQLLIFGRDNVRNLLYDRLSFAADNLFVQVPERLFGNGAVSIRQGVSDIGGGLVDILAALIGLPEKVPKWDSETIAQIGQCYEKQDLLKALTLVSGMRYRSAEGTDLNLSIYFGPQVAQEEFKDVFYEMDRQWSQLQFEHTARLRELYRNEPASNERELKIANELVEIRDALIVERLKQRMGQRLSADAAQMLVQHLLACRIIAQITADARRAREAAADRIRADLRARYPIRSRVSAWLSKNVEKLLPPQPDLLQHAAALFQADASFRQVSTLLQHHRNYGKNSLPDIIKRLSAARVAADAVPLVRRIWLPKNYVVKRKRNASTGQYYYWMEQWQTISIPSSRPFWRVQAFGYRILTWWSTSLFYLVPVSMWSGPLSIRALLLPNEFYPATTVDSSTGQRIRDRNITVMTLIARLKKIWQSVAESRRRFEAEPDTGFFGKSFTRIFNWVWNVVCKGLTGSALVLLVQPVLTVVNLVACAVLAVTTFLWVPAAVILHRLFQLVVYDDDHVIRGSRYAPLLTAITRFALGGIGRIVGSVVAGVAGHPLVAAGTALAAYTAAAVRNSYDLFMYYLAIKPRARIPQHDGFLARMTSGPGMAEQYWAEISPEEALVAVQEELELEELNYFSEYIKTHIRRPLEEKADVYHKLFSAVGADMNASHSIHTREARSTEQLIESAEKIIAARRKIYPKMKSTGKVKQKREMLQQTLVRATALVTDFVSNRLMPLALNKDDPWRPRGTNFFWNSRNLQVGDWEGLTKQYLGHALGETFLTPLEDADKTFKLEVKQIGFREFVRMVEKGQPHDHLDAEVAKPGDTRAPPPVPPTRVALQQQWIVDREWLYRPSPSSVADAITASVATKFSRHADSARDYYILPEDVLAFNEQAALNPPTENEEEIVRNQ